MRCKQHLSDQSSTIGVCASCLRHRLLSLISVQSHHHHAPPLSYDSHLPPPLNFPRSVSPYLSHHHHHNHHHQFYRTPQVGPTHNNCAASRSYKRTHTTTLSRLSNLFRSRSDKLNPDPSISISGQIDSTSVSSSTTSSSWFSSIFSGGKKKATGGDFNGATERKHFRRFDRGMSPVRRSDNDCERSSNNLSGNCSPRLRKTPVAPSAVVRRGKAKSVSGLTFCLSPLVRASPNRGWNSKGGLSSDGGYGGEVKVQAKMTTETALCKNRSRKLVDFGRGNRKR